jgi:hypothetical protein
MTTAVDMHSVSSASLIPGDFAVDYHKSTSSFRGRQNTPAAEGSIGEEDC